MVDPCECGTELYYICPTNAQYVLTISVSILLIYIYIYIYIYTRVYILCISGGK